MHLSFLSEGGSVRPYPRRLTCSCVLTNVFVPFLFSQTSFRAHSGKAAVTSMAVERRSESILLTGSAEGDVRVWSLREHPVSRVSGFRSGDSGNGDGGGGGGGGGARGKEHSSVTQLGIFEGGGRAAALDGLVRIWDVER